MDKKIEKFIKENSVDEGFLQDWYQNSVSETDTPVWTDEHITEVFGDFYLIPREVVDGKNLTSIDSIVDKCNELKANEEFEVLGFGTNHDLTLHIEKDSEYDATVDKDYSNLVTISTFRNKACVDDTGDIYVTDGALYRELERINNYRDFKTL